MNTSEVTIAQHLNQGGVIAYPTETVWGLGADIRFPQAVDRIFEIKGRDAAKAVSLLVRDIEMARQYAKFDRSTERLMELFWPGPLTLVVPATRSVPDVVTGGSGFVGLRCSSHPWVHAFMRENGHAITTTSANKSGATAAKSSKDLSWLPNDVKVVSWGEVAAGKGSTVIRMVTGGYSILRDGDLPVAILEKAARDLVGLNKVY